jgi:hypothetical protein
MEEIQDKVRDIWEDELESSVPYHRIFSAHDT